MNIAEFQEKFDNIKKMGFVPSQRRGPTGVGHTLERLLGLTENNIATPDLGEVELKARRTGSTSMVTLFTFNRKVWKMNPLEAIKKYGTLDKEGRKGMYFTMSPSPNGSGLFLHVTPDTIDVRDINGVVIAEWNLERLAARFMEKLPSLLLVSARSEMRESEWFQYERAQMLSQTSADIIRSQIAAGSIKLDLRLHEKATSARNHGTAFRVFEEDLPNIFATVKEISG